MAFCKNCGQELEADSKFCKNCGTQVVEKEERKIVYEGKIHKCINCGEVLNSLTAICPACGFEFQDKKISNSISEFIEKINACDNEILNSNEVIKTGWDSWDKTKRTWWVILNVITCCIPLVIYLILPLVMHNAVPKLTIVEKRKVELIENFPFPNERESILEALLFLKEKIAYIASRSIDRKTVYWSKLWYTKAEQLYQKSTIMFKGDNVADAVYTDILKNKNKIDKTVKVKAIAGVAIFIVYIVIILIIGLRAPEDYAETFKWRSDGLFVHLPEPQDNLGKIESEYEKSIQIELYQISEDEFEAYVEACREKGFIEKIQKTGASFSAYNEAGYHLHITYNEINDILSIDLDSYAVKEK